MAVRQVSVRPRVLTVGPVGVPLRSNFACCAGSLTLRLDSDAQYDKLLSAYAVAEWSEPLFNNRALFSDYYLNERLPDLPEWNERPEATYRRLRELMARLREQTSDREVQAGAETFVKSTLETLGFVPAEAPAGEYPNLRLFSSDRHDGSVALCLAYPWNRYLDGRDETRDVRTPDDNPSANVVSVLESGEAPWAILTNGKLWRLYSARTHSRSTNYYEIDLQETLAMSDPNEAFRYFWLFFRLNAFVPRDARQNVQTRKQSFLDMVLDESESYAKGLGDRLKERVFEEVFPHFATGFIAHLKDQAGREELYQTSLPSAEQLALNRELDEEFLSQVFNGTLTLLYRLLFLLYAESRGLLPVKEERGYWEKSLSRLKEDIAGRAGPIADSVATRLGKAYRASAEETELYDRLLELFSTIDRGSRELNVPLYNGGLFITKPDAGDRSQEAETARFLVSHKIPDRYLALGLDLLARDLDDKRQDLVFIDYKSLGVRQLGSIYEGLLEFRVRVAQEKMAVVRGRKTEEVIPYSEAAEKKRRVLKVGRGRKAEERVYQPGAVYLENDRRERKASGSYYTPEYIVKYIVENAVGPVLSKKFKKLRLRFREAGERYHQKLTQSEALRKQGMPFDDPTKVADTYAGLVDDLFDLRVLDPAVGSGHFLVEAVDFICDRILGESEGFLRAFPWNPVTRFLQDTREAIVAEMERQRVTVDVGRLTDINLLKRHVLKRCVYGVDLNPMAVELAKVSLWLDCFTIGAPLSFLDHHIKCGNSLIGTTVQEVEAELASQKQGHVSDLFGGPFQGLLSATDTVEQLRRIPDATVEQAERSHRLFTKFEEAQVPHKSALNIWVSQHFDNKLAAEYLTLAGIDLVNQIRSGGKGLSAEYRDTISLAGDIGRKKRFFHWDLEFPEAFVNLDKGQWKAKSEQGFDAVIGNPPYGVSLDASDKRFFQNRFRIAARPLNIAGVFYAAGVRNWSINSSVGMIIPKSITFSRGWEPVVEAILPSLVSLVDVSKAFPEVLLEQVIAVCGPTNEQSYLSGVMSNGSLAVQSRQSKESAKSSNVLITGVNQPETLLAEKLLSSGLHFGDVTQTFRGLPWQRRITSDGVEPLVGGKDLNRYAVNPEASSLPLLSQRDAEKVKRLRQRKIVSQNIVAHIGNPYPHIRIVAALDQRGVLDLDTVNNTISLDEAWPLEVLLALLNSKVYSWFMYRFIYNQAIRTMHFDSPYVSRLPLPPPRPEIELNAIVHLTEAASKLRSTGTDSECDLIDSQIDHWAYEAFGLTDVEIDEIERTTFHGSS